MSLQKDFRGEIKTSLTKLVPTSLRALHETPTSWADASEFPFAALDLAEDRLYERRGVGSPAMWKVEGAATVVIVTQNAEDPLGTLVDLVDVVRKRLNDDQSLFSNKAMVITQMRQFTNAAISAMFGDFAVVALRIEYAGVEKL